jgi:hypothetical protein
MRPAFFRMNFRVFTSFLVVGLVLLVVASYFVVGIGQASLREAAGENLQAVADHTAASVDAYVFRRIIDASVLARIPDVRQEASAASKAPFDREAALEIDREWQQSGAAPKVVRTLLSSKASNFLAEVSRYNSIYRELLLADRYGRLAAASGPTSNYLQSDEDWWRQTFGAGVRGQMTVSDVQFDQSSESWGIDISVPVEEPAGGALAGVLKAHADIRELNAVLGGLRLGNTGEAALLREDGSFVLSLRPVDPNARFFATDLLREHMARVKQGQPQVPMHFAARGPAGTPRLVGVAPSQLKASYPRLAWIVAVSQAEDELFASARAQGTSLMILLGLVAIAVLLLALWFSMRLAAPPEETEMDMHLVQHPKIPRLEESGEDESQAV